VTTNIPAVVVGAAPEPTVLVVDDSLIDQRRAGRLIEKQVAARVLYASNGAQALATIDQGPPDVVLTDLQMPEMNGLELVQALQDRQPPVPVVLMTARGSEEIALEALKKGAASYIPKRILATDLGQIIKQVLVAAQSGRRMEKLLACLQRIDCQFRLPNNPDLIDPLATRLNHFLSELRLCNGNRKLSVYIALEEALRNAMYHGNLEVSSELRQQGDGEGYHELVRKRRTEAPYSERALHVEASVSSSEAVFKIRDEGPGFDLATVPDPTDPANLDRPSGRGLLLIQMFMDDVRFNEKGNQITLIKRPDTPRPPA